MPAYSHTVKRVLLIDIPTYKVSLPELHRKLITKRLHAQTILWQNRTGMNMIRPSLAYSRGLLTIAAVLEQHGFLVQYLVHSDPKDRSHILSLAKEADVVCVTVMTPTVCIANSICEDIKKNHPEVIIIWGGPHVSSRPIETLQDYNEVDFVMVGESENRLCALLESINIPDVVGGVAYRVTQDQIEMSSEPIVPINVSELPMPAYHLLNRPLSKYSHNIKMVRGCPYKCKFCAERLSWSSSHISEHSPQQILEEIEFLSKYVHPGTLIHFSDAIFDLCWGRKNELLDLINHMAFDLVFSFDTRVDNIQESHVKALYQAGFIYFRMGFESIHDDILDQAMKSSTREKQKRASEIIRSVNPKIAIHAYMITGLPASTKYSIAMDAIGISELISNDQVDVVGQKILVPYPGTPYHDNATNFGIQIQSTDWRKYDRRSYPVYCLENLSADEIYFGYLYQEACLTEAYLKKIGDSLLYENSDLAKSLDYLYANYAEK